eukprot:1524470-Prymnesium_polylepis.1
MAVPLRAFSGAAALMPYTYSECHTQDDSLALVALLSIHRVTPDAKTSMCRRSHRVSEQRLVVGVAFLPVLLVECCAQCR